MVVLNKLVDYVINLLNFEKLDWILSYVSQTNCYYFFFFSGFLKVSISFIFNNTVMGREQDIFEFILLKILNEYICVICVCVKQSPAYSRLRRKQQ